MSRSTHQAIAAWGFAILFIAFLVAVFWGDDQIAQWKQPILALFASLLAGVFGFFIMGSTRLVAEAKWRAVAFTFRAGGAAAFFGIVFLGWLLLVPGPAPPLSGNNTINTSQQSEPVSDLKLRIWQLEEEREFLRQIIIRLIEADRQRALSES